MEEKIIDSHPRTRLGFLETQDILLSIALFKYPSERKSFLRYTKSRRLLARIQPAKIKWFQSCKVSIGFMSLWKPFYFSLAIARWNWKWTEWNLLNGIIREPNLQNVRLWRQRTAHSLLPVKSFYSNSNNELVKWLKWKAKKFISITFGRRPLLPHIQQ